MTRSAYVTVLALAATYKSIEHLAVFGTDVWPLIGGLLAIGALLTGLRARPGMAVVASGALVANLTPAYRNHLHLLMFLALTMALFEDERTERWVLRCQLTILYAFAATAKLNEGWLSGDALEAQTWPGDVVPTYVLAGAAVGTILVEAVLAAAVWMSWTGWFWLAVGSHVAFLALTQTDPWDVARLTTFGVLSLATWCRATASGRTIAARIGGD